MATYDYYSIIQMKPKIVITHGVTLDLNFVKVNSIFTYYYNKEHQVIKMPKLKASDILRYYDNTDNSLLKQLLEMVAFHKFYILDIDVKPIPPKGSFSKKLHLIDKKKRLASVDIISRAERLGM